MEPNLWSLGLGAGALWVLYLLLCYGVIVAIGVLTGFELPLLISLRKFEKEDTVNTVLGVDYFGSLLGAVSFPLLLWPQLGLFAVASVTRLLNALVCVLLLATKPALNKRCYAVGTVLVGILLVEFLFYAPRIEQFFLQRLYFYREIQTTGQLLGLEDLPKVESYRSPISASI